MAWWPMASFAAVNGNAEAKILVRSRIHRYSPRLVETV